MERIALCKLERKIYLSVITQGRVMVGERRWTDEFIPNQGNIWPWCIPRVPIPLMRLVESLESIDCDRRMRDGALHTLCTVQETDEKLFTPDNFIPTILQGAKERGPCSRLRHFDNASQNGGTVGAAEAANSCHHLIPNAKPRYSTPTPLVAAGNPVMEEEGGPAGQHQLQMADSNITTMDLNGRM